MAVRTLTEAWRVVALLALIATSNATDAIAQTGTPAARAPAPKAAPSPEVLRARDARRVFGVLVQRHVDVRARLHPEWATSVGLHTADYRLDDRSAAAHSRDSTRAAAERRLLRTVDTAALVVQQRIDWVMLAGVLDSEVRESGLREWERRPGAYVPFGAVYSLAVGTTPEGPARMLSLVRRLEQWPSALATGRKQIVPARTPALWVDLEIGNTRRIAGYLRNELPGIVQKSGGEMMRFTTARDTALRALERYTAWMTDTLRPRATGEWQLGQAEYDWRLRNTKLLDTSADSLIALGRRVFAETETQLATLARSMDSTRSWRALADSSKQLHPEADDVFAAYEREAKRARQFILDKKLFTIPPSERLEMVLTPPNLRQTYAYGGYSSAAPFEKTRVGRFFVTPVEPGSTAEQVESKLRGHNYGWITVVALHEGYPGHHLQNVRAAVQPSILRKIYRSEVFGEGWGLYSEELMYQHGFYPNDLARLTQLRMRLWRAARVIIDPSIHTGRMSFDEAVTLLVDGVGLERADAVAEVTRYTTWPTQAVSYIVGMREMETLRDEVRVKEGERFDLARFHDILLEQGSLPPPLMRRAVIEGMVRGKGKS